MSRIIPLAECYKSYDTRRQNIIRWDEFNINYWAIPKNASTSLKRAYIEAIGGKTSDPHRDERTIYITNKEALSNGYGNMAVTRNPYNRFISMYRQVSVHTGDKGLNSNKIKNVNDFIAYIKSQKDDARNVHFKTQSNYVNYPNINYYDISQMRKLSDDLGFKVPHNNKGNSRQLTDQQKELVYEIYKIDFDNFGYDK